MAHIKLADLTAEATTVEMFEHTYTVNTITRSVQKKLEKVEADMRALTDDDDSDKGVAVIIAGLDALLSPENGAPPAAKPLKAAWQNDTLSLDQINALYESVQEQGVKRPT